MIASSIFLSLLRQLANFLLACSFQVAYDANMAKVQANLKNSVENQCIKEKSLERLSSLLSTNDGTTMEDDEALDVLDPVVVGAIALGPGENMVPAKKSRRQKHKIARKLEAKKEKVVSDKPSHRARYHCEF
jgi:hypothetical protein